jgi:glutaredoxin
MENQFKRVIAFFLFVICFISVSSVESAEIYKWKGEDGHIVYSDTALPPSGDTEGKKFKEEATGRPVAGESLPKCKSEIFEGKRAYRDIHVIMYMTSWCPYCSKARNYLRSLDVNLIEYDIEKDRNKREEMLSKSGGSRGVPLIDIEGIIVRGYNSDAMRAAIEERRGK